MTIRWELEVTNNKPDDWWLDIIEEIDDEWHKQVDESMCNGGLVVEFKV